MTNLFRLILLFTLSLGSTQALAYNSDITGSSNSVPDWSLNNGAVYDGTESTSAGSGSLKLTHTDTNWAKRDNIATAWNSKIPVVAGKTYTLSMKVKTSQSVKPKLFIFGRYITDGSTNNYNDAGKIWSNTKTNEWEYVTHKITPKANDKYFFIYVTTTSDSPYGPIWLDEIKLTDDAVTNGEPEEEVTNRPAEPTGLEALEVSETSIKLHWRDNSNLENEEDAFLIYRDGAFVAAVEPNQDTFIDSGFKASAEQQDFKYTVYAVNSHSTVKGTGTTGTFHINTITSTSSGGSNMIGNGNFKGIVGWERANGAVLDTGMSEDSGTGSIKLTKTSTDWSQRDYFEASWNSMIPVEPGKTYTLSVSTRTEAGKSPTIFLFGGYGDKDKRYTRNDGGGTWKNSKTEIWETFSIKIKPQAGEYCFLPKVTTTSSSATTPGPIWIDNIRLTEDGVLGTTSIDDSLKQDSDGDGVSDATEIDLGTNPHVSDASVSIPATATPGKVSASLPTSELVSAVKGTFSVNQGRANYNIDIAVPPGRAGMQPKLSLNYNSNGEDGYLGKGWGVGGLSIITRCPNTKATDGKVKAVYVDNSDNYCLNGQRLIRIGDTHEYKTEIDNFSKIVADFGSNPYGPESWTVQTKSGLIYEYGNVHDGTGNDSRIIADYRGGHVKQSRSGDIDNSQIVLSWAVNKITDKTEDGNSINFFYGIDEEHEERFIDFITYSGGKVKFNYEPRDLIIEGYIVGSAYKISKLISSIDVYDNGAQENLINQYSLHYFDNNIATFLDEIRMKIKGKTLNPLKVEWDYLSTPSYPGATVAGSNKQNIVGIIDSNNDGILEFIDNDSNADIQTVGDIDGDGYADAITYENKSNYEVAVTFGSAFGGSALGSRKILTSGLGQGMNFDSAYIQFVDMNGDGKSDFVATKNDGVYLSLGTGTSFPTPQKILNNSDIRKVVTPIYIVDLNRDGFPDILHFHHSFVEVAYNDNGTFRFFQEITSLGASFTASNSWGDILNDDYAAYPRTLGDINGDGYVDIIGFGKAGVYVSLNTGDGYLHAESNFETPYLASNNLDYDEGWRTDKHKRIVADMNNDGKADIVAFKDNKIDVYIGNGQKSDSSFTSYSVPLIPSTSVSNQHFRTVADMNNDGILDIIYAKDRKVYSRNSKTVDMKINRFYNEFDQDIGVQYSSLHRGIYEKLNLTTDRNIELTPPLRVVSSVNSLNGRYNQKNYTTYNYAGYVVNRDRGSQGFQKITTYNSATKISRTTQYNQVFPITGSIKSAISTDADEKKLSVSIFDYYAKPYTDTDYEKVYLAYPSMTITTDSLRNVSTIKETILSLDHYGDTTYTSTSTGSHSKTITQNDYKDADEENWIIGRGGFDS